jgi:hypothetical protein
LVPFIVLFYVSENWVVVGILGSIVVIILPILILLHRRARKICLQNAMTFAEAKKLASGPDTRISLPHSTEKLLERYHVTTNNTSTYKHYDSTAAHYDSTAAHYDSAAFVSVASGCGADGGHAGE